MNNENTDDKIIVGLSGGVDSAVAASLLIDKGFNVEALFMKNWEEDDTDAYCSAETDLADAQQVSRLLGISLHTVNFSSEYWDHVFEHFLSEYKAGRTPNPDVLCNREIKFKAFLDFAIDKGASRIATGHYAQIKKIDDEYALLKACDENKDQSYFLHLLNQQQLSKSLFPLGELSKPQVREIARERSLAPHDKKDSTGICFIGERPFKEFLEQYLPAQPGKITDADGNVIGTHQGLMYYTIGQRQGLGIGGSKDYSNEPWFVADKDLDNNVLIAVQGTDNPLLYKTSLSASQIHWIRQIPTLSSEYRCMAKTRYRQDDQPCKIILKQADKPPTITDKDIQIEVHFDAPQRAITPGQSVVFYNNNECLGGGIILHGYNS